MSPRPPGQPKQKGVFLDQYLDLVLPHLRESLVSAVSKNSIKRLSSNIPGPLAFSAFGFECRLGEHAGKTDFLISLTRDNGGPDILAGSLSEHNFSPTFTRNSHWKKIRSFGEFWANPSNSIAAGIDDVWLEFDLHAPHPIPVPSLFFSPLQNLTNANRGHWGTEKLLRLMETVYPMLNGRLPSPVMVQQWRRSIEAVPLLKNLFQTGFMISRSDGKAIRFCILLPLDKPLKKVLLTAGWPGDPKKLVPMLETLAPFFSTVTLHLDVGEEIPPKIGFEFKFPRRPGPEHEKRWHPFLLRLQEAGLCSGEECAALLEFPGYEQTNPDTCPYPLAHMIRRVSPSHRSFFVRTIYHIKLVFHGGGSWEAKVYLGVNHLWKALEGKSVKGRGPWEIIG